MEKHHGANMLAFLTGGWAGVLKLLANPKNLLYIGGALLAGFIVWEAFKFVNTAIDNAALVEQQRIEIQLKDGELETQRLILKQAHKAAAISEAARLEAERRESEIRQIRDAILQSGDDRDGDIAPVLGDTLRALRDRP